jgi:hypothetical protein
MKILIIAIFCLFLLGCQDTPVFVEDTNMETTSTSLQKPSPNNVRVSISVGYGSWVGVDYVVPVIINDNVTDIMGISTKIYTRQLLNTSFSVTSSISGAMLFSRAYLVDGKQCFQCDMAVMTVPGWSGKGQILTFKFKKAVRIVAVEFSLRDSMNKEFTTIVKMVRI